MIDIIIVNWNAGLQLRDCIASIRTHGADLVGKCVVVDNGSSDGSADFLSDARDVELVLAGRNLGFGAGCNLGVARGDNPYILLLNPDACLMEGALTQSMTFLQAPENAAVGVVGIQLVGEDGKVQRTCARFPGPLRLIAKSLGLTTFIRRADFHRQDWDHSETAVVDHVIGAFYLIRRDIYECLGGFDEQFFVYLEDLDLSLRMSRIGYSSVYLAGPQAFHRGGGVSEQVRAHRLFYSLRSRIQYASKHFSRASSIAVGAATLLIEPVTRSALAISRGRGKELKEIVTAYRLLLAWIAGNRSR